MTLRLGYSRPLGPLHPHLTLRFGKKAVLKLQRAEGPPVNRGRGERSWAAPVENEEAFQTCRVRNHPH